MTRERNYVSGPDIVKPFSLGWAGTHLDRQYSVRSRSRGLPWPVEKIERSSYSYKPIYC